MRLRRAVLDHVAMRIAKQFLIQGTRRCGKVGDVVPPKLCHERNRDRPDHDFGSHIARQLAHQLRRSLRRRKRERFLTCLHDCGLELREHALGSKGNPVKTNSSRVGDGVGDGRNQRFA